MTYRDSIRRTLIAEVFSLHKSGLFMPERLQYYKRRDEKDTNPNCLSVISDGMQQNHSTVPYEGNKFQFTNNITMHLLGFLEHGQRLTIFRTFPNVSNNANLTIHCMLYQLNIYKQRCQKFPHKLNWQIDGGAENANKNILAFCEMLVSLRIIQEIVLTRLPTGHTHEDIDSHFGRIWTSTRSQTYSSPQEYKNLLERTTADKVTPIDMVDVHVVGDYTKLFETYEVDKNFKHWTKNEFTQHQWKFEAIEKSEHYPKGVKIQYRQYASDLIVDVKKLETLDKTGDFQIYLGLEVSNLIVKWFPESIENSIVMIQQDIDFSVIEPQEFSDDFLINLKSTFSAVKSRYGDDSEAVEKWEEWMRTFPSTQNVSEWVEQHPREFIIPLQSIINKIRDEAPTAFFPVPAPMNVRDLPTYVVGESVIHSRKKNPDPYRINISVIEDSSTILLDKINTFIETLLIAISKKKEALINMAKLYNLGKYSAQSTNPQLIELIQHKIREEIIKRVAKLANNDLIQVANTLNDALSDLKSLKPQSFVDSSVIGRFFELFTVRESKKINNINKKNRGIDHKFSIYCNNEIKENYNWTELINTHLYIFVPIYVTFEACWILIIINCEKKLIELFSTATTISINHKCIVDWRNEWKAMITNEDGWPFGQTYNLPCKDDECNSGVHVMMFADFMSNRLPYLIVKDDSENMRNRICYMIMNGALKY